MNIYEAVVDIQKKGMTAVLCTIIESHGAVPRHTGSKMLVLEDGSIIGSVGGGETEARVIQGAKETLLDGKSRILSYKLVNPSGGDPGICGGQVEVYVEPILPNPMIVVIGGGHVGRAVVHLGKWLDFRVVVSDDRPEYCNPIAVPEADEYVVCKMAEIPERININTQTSLVLTTRGVSIDTPGMPVLLETKASYFGVIGSKRRWITTRKNLLEAGISEDKLKRVISPIGIELKAETPEEIAVSILAEILMVRNGASGQRMTMKQSD